LRRVNDPVGIVLNIMLLASRRWSAMGLKHLFRPTPYRHVTAVDWQDNLNHSPPRFPGRAAQGDREVVLHDRQGDDRTSPVDNACGMSTMSSRLST
jgi:hypothetical protein